MELKETIRKLQPLFAVLIFVMLILICVQLVKYNELQKEININCGWNDENYKCYCASSDIIKIQNEINKELNIKDLNLSSWE